MDCAISIVDASAADDGVWTCHAKKNVRDDNSVESAFTISVASPYAVSLVSTLRLSFSVSNSAEK